MAIIVLIGLVAIPSMFTWFNLIAGWDPFGNTRNLTVAVASTDEGFKSDLIPLRIDAGERVLSALRANDQLNWEFTSKDDAIEGTKSEKYYAAIVLPPTFSADLLSFYTNGSQRIGVDYYTNEKKNAIAPKITEQGASEVVTKINATFAETLGEAALNIISSLSDFLNSADTKTALTRLQARVGQAAAQLRAGASTSEMFTSLIASSKPLVNGASDLVTASNGALGDASAGIGRGVEAAKSLKSTLDTATASLSGALAASATNYDALAARADEVFTSLDQQSGNIAGAIQGLSAAVQTQIDQFRGMRDGLVATVGPRIPEPARGAFDGVVSAIDDAIARQQALHDRIQDVAVGVPAGNSANQATLQEIRGLVDNAKRAVQDAENAYNGNLKPKLDLLAATLSSINNGIASIGNDLSEAASTLSGDAGSLVNSLSQAESTTTAISGSLTEAAGRFDNLAAALTKAIDTGDLSDLTSAIGSDPKVLATSLSAPVALNRVPVYSVASFGSAMMPFYTVLALWVGALLTAVSIRVNVPEDALGDGSRLTLNQSYLGRYGMFALIGFLQSTLVCLGNIFFVEVHPVHPVLLILAGWVASFVFTVIVYTLVAAFGNAGKAMGVILLVIQISAGGGAYPLQVLPQWFQNISPFLPATHAVNALRSALAGIYNNDYWISLCWLLMFVPPALLLGLVLRRPLINYNRNLERAVESTKLM